MHLSQRLGFPASTVRDGIVRDFPRMHVQRVRAFLVLGPNMAINQKMNIGQTLRLHHGEAKKRHKVGVLDTHGERRKGQIHNMETDC